MSKLYALLVGIDKYHPDSGVGNLDGCQNDIKAVNQYLKKYYKSITPSVKTLVNKEATRENIIDSFQSHLIKKAKRQDTVLFYYSGHGSYASTAEGFKHYDPHAQDETMVCYDSRLDGHYDLADKELAVLLSRIDPGAHIVVIVDSCHSASMTRSISKDFNFVKKRFTGSRENEPARPIHTYLLDGDHYYEDNQHEDGSYIIPRSKHILLSACDRDEEALETVDKRGLFSSTLMEVLGDRRDISYADLFVKVRHNIQEIAKSQLPTFYPNEGFNPNTVFLKRTVRSNHKRHTIKYVKNTWRLDYGAIHGLPTKKEAVGKLLIGVFESAISKKQLFSVKVKKVLLKESILELEESDSSKVLAGEIQTLPTPMLVHLNGLSKDIKLFRKNYQKSPSPFLLFDEKANSAKYSLTTGNRKLLINLTSDGSLIHGVHGTGAASINYIKEILEKIEEWERLSDLQNDQTKIAKAIELQFVDAPDDQEKMICKGDTITMDYPRIGEDTNEDGDLISNGFEIIARNKSRKDYYIALMHLSVDFQVSTLFNCQKIKAKSNWFTLDDEHGLFIEREEWNEVTDVFKLIVSTEAFDDYKFQQEGFERGKIVRATKGIRKRGLAKRKKDESDWCTHTITVNTIRIENSIGERDIKLNDDTMIIKGHPSFKADIAFAPVKSATRSVHPQAALAEIFRSPGLELVNMAPKNSSTRSIVQDKTIIELSGIDAKAERSLKKKPLEIVIKQSTKTEEQIIPVTFDGDFIIPFGSSSKEKDGSTKITISSLPTSKDIYRKRSLKKAVWFCLLKVAGFRNKAFRLRHARLNRKGEIVRNTSDIISKVDQAKKILIVIHGIIGDTKEMSKSLMFLVDPDDSKKYDVMLSFDYENLNEPIEKTAIELNSRLEDLGLGAKDKKQVDIITHSMGGLVSRHLIEEVRKGDGLIDRLIMLGTPNGGSPFGSIPEYIEMFTNLLTVAINFAKPFLAPLITYLSALEKISDIVTASKHVTVTLDQMSATSPFIKKLSKNKKPSTQYYVIAGDSTQYVSKKDKGFGHFMEKGLLKLGDKLSHDMPNDIAVEVEQIRSVPKSFKPKMVTVTGHHMNYFEEGEAMEQLRELLND